MINPIRITEFSILPDQENGSLEHVSYINATGLEKTAISLAPLAYIVAMVFIAIHLIENKSFPEVYFFQPNTFENYTL